MIMRSVSVLLSCGQESELEGNVVVVLMLEINKLLCWEVSLKAVNNI